jgi:hypothetical protein
MASRHLRWCRSVFTMTVQANGFARRPNRCSCPSTEPNCRLISLHAPHSAGGIRLALDPKTFIIEQVSENSEQLLGLVRLVRGASR